MITALADAPGTADAEPFAGPDHPIRKVTRQIAFGGGWTADRRSKVASLFDDMAADWATTSVDPTKSAPIVDAIDRGLASATGRWLELGAGTGAGTRVLRDRLPDASIVAVDLSVNMLAETSEPVAPLVLADASTLPVPDDAVDRLLCLNMFLFPAEVDRVLAPGGVLIWVNSLGDQTPIHLSAEDVVDALPGSWQATTARAGTGLWAVVSRSSAT